VGQTDRLAEGCKTLSPVRPDKVYFGRIHSKLILIRPRYFMVLYLQRSNNARSLLVLLVTVLAAATAACNECYFDDI